MFLAWSILAGNFLPLKTTMNLYNIPYHLEHVMGEYWVILIPNQIRVEVYKGVANSIKHLDPIELKSESDYLKFKLEGRNDSTEYKKVQ